MKTVPATVSAGASSTVRTARAGVADVDVGAPELLAEDFELAVGPQFAGELVDGQVEAHPPSHAVDGGEAQAGGLGGVRAAAEDQLLHPDLLLGVERHRAQLALLGDRHVRVGHAPVVGAGGGEHEALDAGRARVGDERAGGLHVDVVGEPRDRARTRGRRRSRRGARPHGRRAAARARASASRMSPRITSTPARSCSAAISSCPCSRESRTRTSCPSWSSSWTSIAPM